MPRPFCFEPNNQYVVSIRFQRHGVSRRHLTAFILIDSVCIFSHLPLSVIYKHILLNETRNACDAISKPQIIQVLPSAGGWKVFGEKCLYVSLSLSLLTACADTQVWGASWFPGWRRPRRASTAGDGGLHVFGFLHDPADACAGGAVHYTHLQHLCYHAQWSPGWVTVMGSKDKWLSSVSCQNKSHYNPSIPFSFR